MSEDCHKADRRQMCSRSAEDRLSTTKVTPEINGVHDSPIGENVYNPTLQISG